MARKLFPATGQRLIFSAKPEYGAALKSTATTEVAVYEDEACTILADITDVDNAAIEDSILTIGSNSLLPLFKGPDGVSELFAKIGSGVTALQIHDSESGGGGGDATQVAEDLATHEGLTTTAHGGIVASDDARLTDARVPLSHNHSASDITSGLATVATTGAYSDLSGKPTIPDSYDDISAAPAVALPIKPLVSGEYYGPFGAPRGGTAHGLNAAGNMGLVPVWLNAGTYDRIGVRVTAAAVSTWRLGVYPMNQTTKLPDGQTLLLDAGTLSMNYTDGVSPTLITISLTVSTSGIYYLTALSDAYTANPSAYILHIDPTTSASSPAPTMLGVGTTVFPFVYPFRRATGVVTGALPATCPTTTGFGGAPWIGLRAA